LPVSCDNNNSGNKRGQVLWGMRGKLSALWGRSLINPYTLSIYWVNIEARGDACQLLITWRYTESPVDGETGLRHNSLVVL